MEVRDAGLEDRPAVEALTRARCPHTEPYIVESLFSGGARVDVFALATEADQVLGYTYAMHIPGVPEGRRTTHVLVAEGVGGRGVGRALHARLLDGLPPGVDELGTRVYRGDDVAMEVARHWGFEVLQLSVTSSRLLVDEPPAEPPDGVRLEVADDLVLADEDAVEAMFAASQTNPEASNSHLMTIPGIRQYVFPGERGIATLARVDGVPAALCFAVVEAAGDRGSVVYTGVAPAYRGRGLGRLVKQDVHHRASLAGTRTLVTDNEEHNHGIRRLNAEMGYEEVYGVYRMRRTLTPAARAPA